MTGLKRLLKAYVMWTGRHAWLWRMAAEPNHWEWADYLRKYWNLKIGKGTTVNCQAIFMDGGAVDIGCDCSISTVEFITHSGFDRVINDAWGMPTKEWVQPIWIGNRVGIGAGAKIIGPVSIGDDVLIGAGAIVTRECPTGSVVVGVNKIVKSIHEHIKERTI